LILYTTFITRNSNDVGLTKTEKVGFEPTEACTSSDFKSDAIDQLCHLSCLLN
jgi:hypothetical protein